MEEYKGLRVSIFKAPKTVEDFEGSTIIYGEDRRRGYKRGSKRYLEPLRGGGEAVNRPGEMFSKGSLRKAVGLRIKSV